MTRANGAKLWLDMDSTAATVGEAGHRGRTAHHQRGQRELFGTQTQQEMKATSGATVAYDLATGAVRWTNESTRTHRLPVASVPESERGALRRAVGGLRRRPVGACSRSKTGSQSGTRRCRTCWMIATYTVASDVPPVMVGDTAYVVGSTQMLRRRQSVQVQSPERGRPRDGQSALDGADRRGHLSERRSFGWADLRAHA